MIFQHITTWFHTFVLINSSSHPTQKKKQTGCLTVCSLHLLAANLTGTTPTSWDMVPAWTKVQPRTAKQRETKITAEVSPRRLHLDLWIPLVPTA